VEVHVGISSNFYILPYKNSQESLESSAIFVCCFLCKRIVAVVTVFGRMDICHFAGYPFYDG